jgi:flagella synthesis protein FlgN
MNPINPAASLEQERSAIENLLTVLRQEQMHLIDADVDAMAGVTPEKSRIATEMSELATRRHQTLAAAGFAATEPGMQAWIDGGNASPAARESWKVLLDLAQTAKEMNRVNGLLISQQLGRNQARLNALQGNAQGGSFYGPNGQATTRIGSRRLVVG